MGIKMPNRHKPSKGFKSLRKNLGEAAGDAAFRSARKLYDDSQEQVPRKTNALAGTAHILENDRSGPKRSASVKYGEPGEGEGIVDYAAAVHEILKASHAPPTKAKFVEDPLVQGIPIFKSYTSTECKKLIGKSFR